MKMKLDEFLESIDPSKNLDEIAAQVDNAFNTFKMDKGIIRNWDEFRRVLNDFCRHVEFAVLQIPFTTDSPPEMYWGLCCQILRKEYGFSGEKTAFEIARTGIEGGLLSILRLLAKRMADDYAQRTISVMIARFYGSLGVDEKLAVCDEYLDKYSHLLPPELTDGSAVRIKANFHKVLEEHPRIIQRLRRISRK
jgi:hypothetical protein